MKCGIQITSCENSDTSGGHYVGDDDEIQIIKSCMMMMISEKEQILCHGLQTNNIILCHNHSSLYLLAKDI